jgi:hypothetical protein
MLTGFAHFTAALHETPQTREVPFAPFSEVCNGNTTEENVVAILNLGHPTPEDYTGLPVPPYTSFSSFFGSQIL